MKIQLSIARDYAPTWGLWEGVRELVQNWMDAFEEGDHVEHTGTRLQIVNQHGAIEQRDIAVLGSSTKAGDASTRGQFGDGLKVGCLALVREGFNVRFRSGGYWYRAGIEYSKTHGAEVLTFRSRRAKESTDSEGGVFFIVEGLTRSQWEELKPRFIFDPTRGPLLEEKPGQIYVKDIWVCERAGFAFGYNLPKAAIGRDRDLVSDFDIRYAAGRILATALENGDTTPARVMGLLSEGAAEAEFVRSFVSAEGRQAIKDAFEDVHGDKAVPVHTEDQHRLAGHLGLTPVIVNAALMAAAPEIARDKLSADSVVCEIDPTDDEADALAWAMELVGEEALDGLTIRTVKFVDKNQLGKREGGVVSLSRGALADRLTALKTLVEEVAHTAGPDGSFEHKHALHDLYVAIVARLTREHSPGRSHGRTT